MKGLSVLTAVVVVVLMVHAGGVSAVGVLPVGYCDPSCAGTTNGDKVVEPYNCTLFYYCNNGDPYGPVACENGLFFDSVLGECGPNECGPKCGPGANCPLSCNDPSNYLTVADAFDCSTYYYCTPDGPSAPQTCSPDLPHFDGHTDKCVNDESVCCGGYCEAYCAGSGVYFVPDPTDCTKFYVCDNVEGTPDEEHHFTCNDGYFDVPAGSCVSGTPPDPCPTLCSAARRRR